MKAGAGWIYNAEDSNQKLLFLFQIKGLPLNLIWGYSF